jgi:hypothetical protein
MAVDVVGLFMALLSFVESSTPSLSAQGEQRRSAFFNIRRDIGRCGMVKAMSTSEEYRNRAKEARTSE